MSRFVRSNVLSGGFARIRAVAGWSRRASAHRDVGSLTGRGGLVGPAVLVVLVAVGLVPASTALAHETPSTIKPVIDGFQPEVAGVEATVQASQAATLVALEVASGTTVEVLDEDGRAWARVTSEQTEVDVTNPTYHASTNARGAVPDPLPDPDVAWVVAARGPAFQWFDHRLHPEALDIDQDVLAGDEERDVANWRVPLRIDGSPTNLLGRLRHVPVTGRVLPRLTVDREVAPGVTVEVAAGAVPVFFLRNSSGAPVTVLAGDGSPYAVVDSSGVRVNLASTTWQEQQRFGEVDDEGDPSVPSEPTFATVSTQPAHSWLDTRAALPGIVPSSEVRSSGREQVLREWSVPLDVGGQAVPVSGELVWQPVLGEGPAGPSALGRPEYLVAAAAALGLAGLLLVRARRRGDGGDDQEPSDDVASDGVTDPEGGPRPEASTDDDAAHDEQ